MNLAMIITTTAVFAIGLYSAFLVIGVGGISKNRLAQGLDQKQESDK
tara:strand:- start:2678 stop:2818 length:141 start_codon:yes stop_codon:yes gene_type:complete